MPSAKRTGWRNCRSQYSGSTTSPPIGAPVRLEMSGMRGDWSVTARKQASNGARTGSISAEWKACETPSLTVVTPASRRLAATASSWRSSPERTTLFGPLSAATEIPTGPQVAARRRLVGPDGQHAAAAGRSCISRARRAISGSPSSSEKTPATQAAAYSPTLCPITAAGSTPQAIQSCASE